MPSRSYVSCLFSRNHPPAFLTKIAFSWIGSLLFPSDPICPKAIGGNNIPIAKYHRGWIPDLQWRRCDVSIDCQVDRLWCHLWNTFPGMCVREIFQLGLKEVGRLGLRVGGIFLMAPDWIKRKKREVTVLSVETWYVTFLPSCFPIMIDCPTFRLWAKANPPLFLNGLCQVFCHSTEEK